MKAKAITEPTKAIAQAAPRVAWAATRKRQPKTVVAAKAQRIENRGRSMLAILVKRDDDSSPRSARDDRLDSAVFQVHNEARTKVVAGDWARGGWPIVAIRVDA